MSYVTAEAAAPDDWLVHYLELPRYKTIFVLSIGLFLCLFLLVFQPFEVSNYDPNFKVDVAFLGYMLGVGVAVTAALASSKFISRPLLLPAAGRRALISWIAWDYILAGTVTYAYYNHLGEWHDLSWSSYLGFLRDVGMVISFPVAGFLLYIRHAQAGNVRYALKSPYRDGTTHVIFEPEDFIARLAALVRKPRAHLTRYHGVFAPASPERAQVVPRTHAVAATERGEAAATGRQKAMTWAQRLKRVFAIDIETCRQCGGELRVIASIEDAAVIERILDHLGHTAETVDPAHPSRAPPQGDRLV